MRAEVRAIRYRVEDEAGTLLRTYTRVRTTIYDPVVRRQPGGGTALQDLALHVHTEALEGDRQRDIRLEMARMRSACEALGIPVEEVEERAAKPDEPRAPSSILVVPKWRCQRCRRVFAQNLRCCPSCGYTVYDPINRDPASSATS